MQQDISTPVRKVDSREKATGAAKYIADRIFDGMLYAKTYRSDCPRAVIRAVHIPKLPDGYTVVDARDIPGKNRLSTVASDEPLFADKEVRYIGQPMLLVVGPDKQGILDIMANIRVDYEEIPPVLTMEDAENPDLPPICENNTLVHYQIAKGGCAEAFAKADVVVKGAFQTGYQEQFYLEPQGMVGVCENGGVTVYGSMQCPYYVKAGVKMAMGWDDDHVRIVQTVTGGGFGGKEEYPSMLAAHVALAAYKTGHPVQLIFDRMEDLEVTPKRHPSCVEYETALTADGVILGVRANVQLNAGAYEGLSSIVLQRSLFNVVGPYRVPHLEAQASCIATNTVPNGAFRGFGGPQVIFAMEMHMQQIARKLGIDVLTLKKRNLVQKGDTTPTNGLYKQVVKWEDMLARLDEMSGFSRKKRGVQPDGRLRGIGTSFFEHGCGFTGSGERDIIKARLRMVKHSNGQVEILASSTDMGQGAKTTLSKIAAQVLELPLERVECHNPDTARVPDSGPTVASRTILIVGKLVEEAARRLKPRMEEPGEVEITQHYVHPSDVKWDNSTFTGDAYPTFAWGVNVVEVLVDPVTFEVETVGVWDVFDVGHAIDARVIRGQIEGGVLQGLGYGGLEHMVTKNGGIQQRTAADYSIPTSMDFPQLQSAVVDNPFHGGPYGAKGAGELTLLGGGPAIAAAISDALGVQLTKLPVTPEYLMEVMQHGKDHCVSTQQ